MSSLTFREKRLIEDVLGMESGHVLNLSKRELAEFFKDVVEIDIYSDTFDYGSGSKANRLRAFWQSQSDFLVARVLQELLLIASEREDVGEAKLSAARGVVARLEDAAQVQPLRVQKPSSAGGSQPMDAPPGEPIEIFFSYAHADEHLMDDVRRQFIPFERAGQIIKWHDRKIIPGRELDQEIDHHLRRAHVILLFVSPHFIESRYCYEREVEVALERHDAGAARVVPVILRPCAWDVAPFARLLALPSDGKPVTQWDDRDVAGLDVARGVMRVVADLRGS